MSKKERSFQIKLGNDSDWKGISTKIVSAGKNRGWNLIDETNNLVKMKTGMSSGSFGEKIIIKRNDDSLNVTSSSFQLVSWGVHEDNLNFIGQCINEYINKSEELGSFANASSSSNVQTNGTKSPDIKEDNSITTKETENSSKSSNWKNYAAAAVIFTILLAIFSNPGKKSDSDIENNSVPDTCKDKTGIHPNLFVDSSGQDQYSRDGRALVQLIRNGNFTTQRIFEKNGHCYAEINVSGSHNGYSYNTTLIGQTFK